jgi:hypothetical protein
VDKEIVRKISSHLDRQGEIRAATQADVERAILDVISRHNVDANEIFDVTNVHMQLQQNGFRAAQINDALASMETRGLIEAAQSPKFRKLTDVGFAAM